MCRNCSRIDWEDLLVRAGLLFIILGGLTLAVVFGYQISQMNSRDDDILSGNLARCDEYREVIRMPAVCLKRYQNYFPGN